MGEEPVAKFILILNKLLEHFFLNTDFIAFSLTMCMSIENFTTVTTAGHDFSEQN